MVPSPGQPLPLLMQQQCALLSPLFSEASAQQQAVLVFSDFISDNLAKYPEGWQQLQHSPPHPDEWHHYADWLQAKLETVHDENALMRELRLFRRHMLTRIAWMQTLATSDTQQSLRQLSELAEALIVAARDWLWHACCRDFGTPMNAAGEPQPLLILGMGKLGGGELNFSSDIDLIFTWPENGTTQGAAVNWTMLSSLPGWVSG
ncbi:hypothetical protein ERHA55_06960 [Erwinia rhapontici]|nr:hypothetical protein ERHA55_06960 [Erwinia rhapontici]